MPDLLHSSAAELVEKQKQQIQFFFRRFVLSQFEELVAVCKECRGKIVFMGVGKSGIIAEKIAKTLISTGTRSFSLCPSDALHGDVGAIEQGDLILILSKSGETQELVSLLPHLKRRGCEVVAITCSERGRLSQRADRHIHLPLQGELCPFDLVPTTSATLQLLFGDLLAVSLMGEKGFDLQDYKQNHPLGSIGKRLTHRVEDLMKKAPALPICGPKDLLVDVLVELSNKQCGCLLIVGEEGKLLGIFTDGDLRRALQDQKIKVMEKPIEELMCTTPFFVDPKMEAHQALKLMQSGRRVTVAPVLENNRVVGLIRMHDIIHEGG